MAPCFSSSLSSPAIAAAILPALRPALFSVSEPAVLTHAKQKSRIDKKRVEEKKQSRIKNRSRGQKKEVADKKKKSRIKKKKSRIKKEVADKKRSRGKKESMSLSGHRR